MKQKINFNECTAHKITPETVVRTYKERFSVLSIEVSCYRQGLNSNAHRCYCGIQMDRETVFFGVSKLYVTWTFLLVNSLNNQNWFKTAQNLLTRSGLLLQFFASMALANPIGTNESIYIELASTLYHEKRSSFQTMMLGRYLEICLRTKCWKHSQSISRVSTNVSTKPQLRQRLKEATSCLLRKKMLRKVRTQRDQFNENYPLVESKKSEWVSATKWYMKS